MTLHKLTAGGGYAYLTRQVAAFDATERGHAGLGDYYSQRGESPGRWVGNGLTGLGGVTGGQPVAEDQMKSLFGEGRHPDADRLEKEALAKGRTPQQARAAGSLGRAFFSFATNIDGFRARCAQEFVAFNTARRRPATAPVPDGDRARIRSDLARAMFGQAYRRAPHDA